jgi:hypothetical protein
VIGRLTATITVALAVAGCGFGAAEPKLPVGRAVLATPTLDQSVHLFGDTVVARLDVLVDAQRLDPDRVELVPRFRPYERVGRVDVERSVHGDITELRYTIRLRCLGPPCVPSRLPSAAGPQEPGRGERRAFNFPSSLLVYEEGERERLLRIVRFPPVESVSRLNESQFSSTQFPFRSGYVPLPGVTWTVHPTLLALLLAAAALALLAPAVLLGRRRLRGRRAAVVVETEPELPPLERALLLVEWTRDRADGEDRRRALELLAKELDVESSPLADDARRLAWSPRSPTPDAATDVVRRVREGMNGRPG